MSEKLTPPALGAYWEGQGGRYIGVHPLGGYLIRAEKAIGEFEYGNYGTRIEGADSDIDGQANTKALIEAGNHPAAQAAVAYEADGHKDFYLPSQREIMMDFAVTGKGDDVIWSSTQNGSSFAWALDFEYGLVYRWSKNCEFQVRPFRLIN